MRSFIFFVSFLLCSLTSFGIVTEKGALSENPVREQKLTPKSSEKSIEQKLRARREAVNSKIAQEYQQAKQKWKTNSTAASKGKQQTVKNGSDILYQAAHDDFWNTVMLLIGISLGVGYLIYKFKSLRARRAG